MTKQDFHRNKIGNLRIASKGYGSIFDYPEKDLEEFYEKCAAFEFEIFFRDMIPHEVCLKRKKHINEKLFNLKAEHGSTEKA